MSNTGETMGLFLDEYDYLIHLVRCAIHDDAPSELSDGAMFDSVYNCAVKHDIANIAYYSVEKLKNKPEPQLLVKWEARRNSAIIRDMNQSFARSELLCELKNAGIRSVEVQGTKLKPMYPQPEYRTMSDIDIIIEPKNLGKTAEILENLGYKCRDYRGFEIDAFRRPNIYIEIHTEFFSTDSDYYGLLGNPFDPAETESGSVEVSREVFYRYSVLHIAKHYYFAGCGIRRMLDLYYLNKNFSDVALSEDTNAFFESAGILEFVSDASELAECWFGDAERLPPERLSHMIEVIRMAGVHGTLSNKLNNHLIKDKKRGMHNIKARYMLRRLFPAKWVFYANYPILKKMPWLIPFCWVHRIFKAIVKDRRRLAGEMKDLKDANIK